ncbi:Hsp70 family protein [Actinomadura barringtoniae]|uniref:Hsp70 family protein n=1 Tax=Actinomadura barringtoniae TaxID=1427535 RepID=A0A939T7B5_9ACTN|nr:Hsp70 family protein [Actinomadura barringtoniae]MBO2445705.1 Hsp70 family protein [Actinomadura barringtoniae]
MTQVVSKAVGIDLGTTNSAVAVMDPADTDIVIHRDKDTKARTTPSCVWRATADGELVVGRKARNRLGHKPEPITSVKRLMGQRETVDLAGAPMSPEEVSAAILAEMKRQIEEDVAAFDSPDTTYKVDRAIVTVPAYFDQPQIDATRRAAEMAGLECLELLHEPTAAASYHCWRTGTRDGVFLVYDLGGGTFDVSVVRCTAGVYDVLGISGNNQLGGDDIDADFARHLMKMLRAQGAALDLNPAENPADRMLFNEIKGLAETVKIGLSSSPEYMWRDGGRVQDQAGEPIRIEAEIERSELDAVVRPLVERTLSYCHEALEAAGKKGITLADVDEVILAGGSTHIPLVQEMVKAELCAGAKCDEPVYQQVDTVVAMGAAIRAAVSGGLAVQDERESVRVSFRGTSASGRSTAHVGGTVEAIDGGVDLAGAYVRLTTPDGSDEEIDLGSGGTFSFTGIPLEPGVETMLDFEVFDASGQLLATAGRSVTHSSEAASRLPGPSNTAVCPKPILLEVSQGGETRRRTLIAELQELPTSAEFVFSHPGDTELLLLPIYQKSRNIQVIRVNVDSSTPRGTPIHLDVQMDKFSLLTARGTIGEQTFEFEVEAPPDRELPTGQEVTELTGRFTEAAAYLPAGRRSPIQIKFEVAREAFERKQADGDVKGAVHEFEQMEELAASIERNATPLQPPKPDFDQIVEDCNQINEALRGAEGGHDPQELARSIEAQRVQGEKAFREGDQSAYSEAIQHLMSYRDHLIDKLRSGPAPDITPEQAAYATVQVAQEEADTVRQLAVAEGRDDLRVQVDTIRRELDELGQQAFDDPRRVLQRGQAARQELERIKHLVRAPVGGGGKLVDDHSQRRDRR